jgi:hypothetical protein
MDKHDDDEIRKKLEAALGTPLGDHKLDAKGMPKAYKDCKVVYRATLDDHKLPLFVGVDDSEEEYLVGFGTAAPFSLTRRQFFYMIAALSSLMAEAVSENTGMDKDEIQQAMVDMQDDVTFGKGVVDPSSVPAEDKDPSDIEGLKGKIFGSDAADDQNIEGSISKLEEMKDTMEEMVSAREDLETMMEGMTEEERKECLKEQHKKEQDALDKKAREFERSLLGVIEEEDETVFNYNYFKEIHEKSGPAALKEELAKIPKEEREEIIQKIMAEYKIKKQQEQKNNEKSDN